MTQDLFINQEIHINYSYDSSKKLATKSIMIGTKEFQQHVKANKPNKDEKLDVHFDKNFLLQNEAPYETNGETYKIIDLFSGCGGLSLGAKCAIEFFNKKCITSLAWEIEETFSQTYVENMAPKHLKKSPIEETFSLDKESLSKKEQALKKTIGKVNLLLGGPPCQGHSDLNNHTRRDDPRNELYLAMAKAASIFNPDHIIIENVVGVKHSKNNAVERTSKILQKLGYSILSIVLNAADFGVAQNRKRHFTIASKFDLNNFLNITEYLKATSHRSTTFAIDDLIKKYDEQDVFNSSANHSATNKGRIDYLFKNDLYELPDAERPDCHRLKKHSYQSVYGRLYPNKPSPTITSGFGSTGQGRFVHPTQRRTLTPHEAARVQSFPDWFQFNSKSRRVLQKTIGNSVPPKLAEALVTSLLLNQLQLTK